MVGDGEESKGVERGLSVQNRVKDAVVGGIQHWIKAPDEMKNIKAVRI